MGMFGFPLTLWDGAGGIPADWYDGAWNRRIPVTIQNAQVAETLTNYPVYVKLSDLPASFFSNLQSAGEDIRVTKDNGLTELPIDVVTVNTGTSVGELHFEHDSVSSSADTKFYIYYDNAGASAYAVGATFGRNAVWATYRGVWHLQEADPGLDTIVDSTGNGLDMLETTTGTDMDTSDSVAGFLEGKGFKFEKAKFQSLGVTANPFSGTPAYPFTMEIAIDILAGSTDIGVVTGIYDKSEPNVYWWTQLRSTTSGKVKMEARNTTAIQTDGTNDKRGAWTTVAVRFNSATDRELIADGVSEATSTTSVSISTGIDHIELGRAGDSSPGEHLDSAVDEMRFSEIDRSLNWYLSQWRNHNTPATFYNVGTEETL